MQSIKARRKTIILTTHYMEEAELLCDEIAIMDRGRVIAQGTPRACCANTLTKYYWSCRGRSFRRPRASCR